MTTSTLDQLRELLPESVVDIRRFRMNMFVDTARARVLSKMTGLVK